MSTAELLEAGKMICLIVGVWFALLGWKLVPLFRSSARSRFPPPEKS
jgi:hypothetical protein